MSEEQLSAFLAKLEDDVGLQEKLKGADDLDAVVAIAQEAGYELGKENLLRHQANQPVELSDEQLEGVAGGQVWDGGKGRALQADTAEEGCRCSQTRPIVNLFGDVL
jgi:predicted ribosomally synthesized peptide with nif11-like leader